MKSGYSVRWYFNPGPARPAVRRLAAGATALKDASRRASARWPRKNEAILDRGDARCLAMFRPGRENGTPAEPENVDHADRLASTPQTRNGGRSSITRRVEFTTCRDLPVGDRIGRA